MGSCGSGVVTLALRRRSLRKVITSFSYVAHASTSVSSITIPSEAQEGDVAFLIDACAHSTNSRPQPSETTAQWTLIDYQVGLTAGGGSYYHSYLSYRILTAGQEGTTVNLTDGSAVDRKFLIVFRPDFYSGYTSGPFDVAGQVTQGTPANQTINASGEKTPLIIFAHFWGGTNSASPGSSVTLDAIYDGSSDRQKVGYKIYNDGTTPLDITVSKNDQGENNVLQSFYFKPDR